MTRTASNRICAGYEPIPGYVLEEVLGRGGFGEVWRASAPGGLKKALKFVFGTQDQSRAARELRSLERIKGVQHPFLLTLERFETIDNQLVIVNELADCSLEDVFNQQRERGSCGIARDVLVAHLSDAADALDYLHQQYQLQHLDIKPGNLLLVGGHVKVADFGLLKDLREVECSIVGGLTPIYAPPEIFDGRPSLHSDQYSLAVMYQEMLTGTRPFSGRTIAQLATQHVHSAPNLEPLPPADRPVVARALEKDPQRRFPDCSAFVQALRSAGKPKQSLVIDGQLNNASAQDATETTQQPANDVQHLPQLDPAAVDSPRSATHHALVIGLGGTGADVLGELRRRSLDSQGNTDLHCLLIDTDMATTHAVSMAPPSQRMGQFQSIHTPLRTAHQYRNAGTDHLRSISRRWIYNVPRSGTTEGMRPLGRLALIDHSAEVQRTVEGTVTEFARSFTTDRNHDSASNTSTSATVFLVGSTSGGTSSGMYLDVVHLVRHALDNAGLADVEIVSLLTMPALQGNPSNPVALYSTEALLRELSFFLRPENAFPGDASASWPSVPAGRTPLRNIYLVAENQHSECAICANDMISEYVWTAVSDCGETLAVARTVSASNDLPESTATVRSLGIVSLGNQKHFERTVLAPPMLRELLIRWLGLPGPAKREAPAACKRLWRRVDADTATNIDPSALTDEALQAIRQCAGTVADQDRSNDRMMAAALDDWLKAYVTDSEFRAAGTNVIRNLSREFSVLLNDQRADITTVLATCQEMKKQFQDLLTVKSKECENEQRSDLERGRLAYLHNESIDLEINSTQPIDPIPFACGMLQYHRIEQMRAGLSILVDRLERFATSLAMAVAEIEKSLGGRRNPWKQLTGEREICFQETIGHLHQAAAPRYLVRALTEQGAALNIGGMIQDLVEATLPLVENFISQHGEAWSHEFPEDSSNLTGASESINGTQTHPIAEPGTHTALTQTLSIAHGHAADRPMSVAEAIKAAHPSLLTFGGKQRLVLLVGSESERSQLEPQIRQLCGHDPTVVVIPGAAPRLIHEAQQISLAPIISRLTVLNGGNPQVTSRLASRIDVSWQ